jgi:hypothetical protein
MDSNCRFRARQATVFEASSFVRRVLNGGPITYPHHHPPGARRGVPPPSGDREDAEQACAQIGGYLNHSGASSTSRLSECGGSSRSSAPATACNVRRNTAFQGCSVTSVVLATKAGFVAIILSKMAC